MLAERGQTTTEYLLVIAVIVIATVGVAYLFLPSFQSGVSSLSEDVIESLDSGVIRYHVPLDLGKEPQVAPPGTSPFHMPIARDGIVDCGFGRNCEEPLPATRMR